MTVTLEKLPLDGLLVVHSDVICDARGYLVETWSRQRFAGLGIAADFLQENQSLNRSANTLRGLHLQRAPFEQAKLVRVVVGRLFDVTVDLRRRSPTFGRWCGIELTAGDGRQLFIPRGVAHGYLTLAPDTLVTYLVDAPYAPGHEAGVRWNDPGLGIDWPALAAPLIVSPRDRAWPGLEEYLLVA